MSKSLAAMMMLVTLGAVGCARTVPQPSTPAAATSAKIDAALATSLEFAPDTSQRIDRELANTMDEGVPEDFEMPLPEERMPMRVQPSQALIDLASKDDLASPAVKTWGVSAKTDKGTDKSEKIVDPTESRE
jgi:hypothetical protein